MPIGSLSEPISIDESHRLIRSGRLFPPQLVSVNGTEPRPAFLQEALQELWRAYTPSSETFFERSGRVDILGLGKLFAQFTLDRFSGRLFIRHNESGLHFQLRFVSGQLLEVSAFDSSTYLGQLLIQRQELNPSELVQVIEHAQQQRLPIGQSAIQLGFITEKTLNLVLANQMFTRIRKIACFPYVDLCFIEDQSVAMVPPIARISGYSLLEITLGYGLSDPQIKQVMGELLDRPVKVNRQSQALRMISAEDRSILKRVDASASLDPLKERQDWTQRDSALKAITWDLISIFEVPHSYLLSQEYHKLSSSDALNYLGLDHLSTPHMIEEKLKSYRTQFKLDAQSESGEEEHIKRAIKAKLIELTRTLEGSERERKAFQRLRQVGADPSDQQLLKNALFEICIQEGEASLKRQLYREAAEAYREAIGLQPNDLNAALNEIWANFLDSSRDQAIFEHSRTRLESLGERHPNSPRPPLFLARIYRLNGDLQTAESQLRKVLKLEPEHQEAQAELRLLFNRDFDKKKRKVQALVQLNPEASTWITALVTTLALTVIFGALGNLITHPRDIWPEERQLDVSALSNLSPFKRQLSFNRIMRTNYNNDSLASAAYRLGLKPHRRAEAQMAPGVERPISYSIGRLEGDTNREITRILDYLYQNFDQQQERVLTSLRASLIIPPQLRVIGNVEHYWLQEDLFGWTRRLVLILIGLLGIYRLRPLELKAHPAVSLSLIAIVYGAAVGYLSPAFTAPTPTPILVGMKVAHSLGEVIFFQFFLGVALLRGFRWSPYFPIFIVSTLFALFKLSYLNIWYMPLESMIFSILQIGIFIGGGCAFFMWKSKSYLPPLLAHLTLTLLPVLRGLS